MRSRGMVVAVLLCGAGAALSQDRVFNPGLHRPVPGPAGRRASAEMMSAPILAAALRGIDPGATVEWERGVLRIDAGGHQFSLFSSGAEIVVDGSIERADSPLVWDGREVYVPATTADRVLRIVSSGKPAPGPETRQVTPHNRPPEKRQPEPRLEVSEERERQQFSVERVQNQEPFREFLQRMRNWPLGAWIVIGLTGILLLSLVTSPLRLLKGLWTAVVYLLHLLLLIPPIPQLTRWAGNQWWQLRNRFRVRASLRRHQRLQASVGTQLKGLYRVADLNEVAARAFLQAHDGGNPDPDELFRAVLHTFREAEAEVLANPRLTRAEKREHIARLKEHIDAIFAEPPAR